MSGVEEEGFLARWSRRKRAAVAERAAPPVAPEAPVPEVVEEPDFDLASLPSLEELTVESDITGFLHKAVPAGMRNAALRRMWTLDPAIRNFIGPVDYAWDFNAPEGIPGISERLVGDVGKLLAQAIGAVDKEPAPEQAVTVALATPEAVIDAQDDAIQDASEAPPHALRVDAPQQTAAEEVPRRRHGSASPI